LVQKFDKVNQDNLGNVATSYRLDGPGLESQKGRQVFTSKSVHSVSGDHPASYWMGTVVSSLG